MGLTRTAGVLVLILVGIAGVIRRIAPITAACIEQIAVRTPRREMVQTRVEIED